MGVFSSIFGAKALKRGEKKALSATTEAIGTAQERYNPYSAVTDKALPAYTNAIGLGDSQAAIDAFRASPAYRLNFENAMRAGTEGVNSNSALAGTKYSGATLKALQDRAQEITDRSYADYVNPLANLNNVGLDIAGKRANLDMSLGDANAGYYRNKAQIKAGQMAGFDSLLNGAISLAGGFGGFGGNPLQTLGERTGFAKALY